MTAATPPTDAHGALADGHLVLDVGRFTWCPAASSTVFDLTLAEALAALDRPRPSYVPDPGSNGTTGAVATGPDTGFPLERTTVVGLLPVATAAGGGGAHRWDEHLARWVQLGPAHLRVLACLGERTPATAVAAAVPDLLDTLAKLLGDLEAAGLVASEPRAEAPPPPAPTALPAGEDGSRTSTADPTLRTLAGHLVRAPRRATGDDDDQISAAADAEPAPVDPRWWSGSGSVPVYSFWSTEEGPPVGVASVVAYARIHDGGRLTATYDLRRMVPPEVVLADLERTEGPAVLLCGNYDWSLAANLDVVERARRIRPDLLVIHGGPSTPSSANDCEPFLRSLDGSHIAVAGEGEITFVEVLHRLASTNVAGPIDLDLRRLVEVAGVRYLDPDSGRYVHGPDRTRHAHLEDFPSPLAGGELELVPFDALNIIPIETNRGCPYSCTFCDWGAATMSRIRQFPLERVRAELGWMATHGVTTWYIADANFGIVARDVEIASDIARYRTDTGFPEILVAFPAKNASERYLDIIDTFISAGITLKAALALQTRDPDTLRAVKRSNIKTESYDHLAAESRRRGLPMLTELMIGLPGATVESFKNDLQWGIDRQVRAFLYPTVVLPNAPMNDAEQRERLAIRTVDGRLVSSFSFTAAQRAEMDRVASAYHCLEIFGTLRHALRYLQWDHQLRAIDVIHQVVTEVDARPERYPLMALHLRHAENFLLPPVGWAPMFTEAHRLLVDHVGAPDDSGLRTALVVSRHLLAWPRRPLPARLELEHDYVAYFRSTQPSLHETGEPGHPDKPLRHYGPGEIEIVADPLDVASLFGRWEDNDPFQQAQDFEPLSPLTAYYSSVGALTA